MDATDQELLQRYALRHDEPAFAVVVERQVDLVYSVALRLLAGDSPLAEDVTQKVFADLAAKAAGVARVGSVAGWLHTHTRFVSLTAIRGERRRQQREQEAAIMHHPEPVPEFDWERLRPLLDAAVGELRTVDRDAIVMRFFQNKSHREVGEALGLSENTARMRIERALEKLQAIFARRGLTVSSMAMALAISGNSVQAAPAGLGEEVAGALVKHAVAPIGPIQILLRIISMNTKTKIIVAALFIAIMALMGIGLPTWQTMLNSKTTVSTLAPSPEPPLAAAKPIEAPRVAPVSAAGAAGVGSSLPAANEWGEIEFEVGVPVVRTMATGETVLIFVSPVSGSGQNAVAQLHVDMIIELPGSGYQRSNSELEALRGQNAQEVMKAEFLLARQGQIKVESNPSMTVDLGKAVEYWMGSTPGTTNPTIRFKPKIAGS